MYQLLKMDFWGYVGEVRKYLTKAKEFASVAPVTVYVAVALPVVGTILDYTIFSSIGMFVTIGAVGAGEYYISKKTGITLPQAIQIVVQDKTGYSITDIIHGVWFNKDHITMDANNRTMTIQYTMDGSTHHVVIHVPKKSMEHSNIFDIVDTDDNKVEEVVKALGPYNDFHGIPTTPGSFGYGKLKVGYITEDMDIKYVEYDQHEPIVTKLD